MKIGIVVDGQAEVFAIRELLNQLTIPEVQFLNPVYADMQPKATALQIARSALNKCQIHLARNVGLIVVLIDLEDRGDCPPLFAVNIRAAFVRLGLTSIEVVVKKRQFENWLIADPESLQRKLPARLNVTPAFVNAVSPNKADSIERPQELLNRICIKSEYHKRQDATNFAKAVEPSRAATNSRSFRRFLRVVGFPGYLTQSRSP